ncbi:hypothetical protein ABFS82_05G030900 [Erythranthe guttata]
MDFHTTYPTQSPTVCSFEEEDDDVLYDELKRQVLQLTADEDEEVIKYENKECGPLYGPFSTIQPVLYNYGWPVIKEDNNSGGGPPLWMLNLWRSTSGNIGTGVFIPQIVHSSRRRNKSRKNKNERGRTYKHVEKMN